MNDITIINFHENLTWSQSDQTMLAQMTKGKFGLETYTNLTFGGIFVFKNSDKCGLLAEYLILIKK